jgi:hypothetical protein
VVCLQSLSLWRAHEEPKSLDPSLWKVRGNWFGEVCEISVQKSHMKLLGITIVINVGMCVVGVGNWGLIFLGTCKG